MQKNNTLQKKKNMKKNTKIRNLWILCAILIIVLFIACRLVTHQNKRFPSTVPATTSSTMNQKQSQQKDNEWYLILVNKWNTLPDDYNVELTILDNGESVDKRVYPALQKMFDAARRDGVYPIVASGYRTARKQQSLMNQKITEYQSQGYSKKRAKKKAEKWVAIPGTSEHQLGIGIDINADGIHSTGKNVYNWLQKNSYKYGFIYRYPEDKTAITGISNEPWHYRYVGVDAAKEIHQQGECLEEYIDRYSR